MFDKLDDDVKNILQMSHREAFFLQHKYIGTEHIFLAILRDDNPITSRLFVEFELYYENVKEKMMELSSDKEDYFSNHLDFTPLAKLSIKVALEEARKYGSDKINAQHLLMSLLLIGEGVAAQAIKSLDVDIDTMRIRFRNILESTRNDYTGDQHTSLGNHSESQSSDANPGIQNVLKFSKNVTEMARLGKLDPVIGRNSEIKRIINILSRRRKNNPCLIGEPGVGKTAVVESLAQRIVDGKVPAFLKDKVILQLDVALVIAGTKFRGEFEERLKNIIFELKSNREIILFIDELHTIVGTGAIGGAMDAANILKPPLSNGEIQAIGATTLKEYRKYIEADPALERRFQPVMIEEPDSIETTEIVFGIKGKYEEFHRVRYSDDALRAAVLFSSRYITERFQPDKSIDLIDESGAKVKLANYESFENCQSLSGSGSIAESKMSFNELDFFIDDEKYSDVISSGSSVMIDTETCPVVTEEDVAEVISDWVKIPVTKIKEDEQEKLLRLEEILQERIVGQDSAIKLLAQAVRRSRAGLTDPRRPIGSFIFLGPTGVGKTELARTLSNALYGTDEALIRIDMSEFMEKHTVSKIVGAPPGYIGYDEAGQLTEKVRRRPYSIVLFDEIEKAHPEVFNVLLQILEDGNISDNQGRKINFRNTIIILTSNVGSPKLMGGSRIGYSSSNDKFGFDFEMLSTMMLEELKKTFRPEFLNRIDDIIVFNPLTIEEMKQIAMIMIKDIVNRLERKFLKLEINEELMEYLASKGHDSKLGARPLRRIIQKEIENPLSSCIIRQKFKSGDIIKVTVTDGNLGFVKK